MLLFLVVIGVGGEWMASAADWDDREVDGESLDDDDDGGDDDEDDVVELTPSPSPDTEDASSETSILPFFYIILTKVNPSFKLKFWITLCLPLWVVVFLFFGGSEDEESSGDGNGVADDGDDDDANWGGGFWNGFVLNKYK